MADLPPDFFWIALSVDAEIEVRFERDQGRIVRYAVILKARSQPGGQGAWQTVRVYDNAHGDHDLHRYKKGRKQLAETFIGGDPRSAMDFAIDQITAGHERMIESWRKDQKAQPKRQKP
jgi:hypothetical protein